MRLHCAPCHQVAEFLRDHGIQFTTRSVDRDPAALEVIVAQGYMATPVVRIGTAWVVGFKRKELERLLAL